MGLKQMYKGPMKIRWRFQFTYHLFLDNHLWKNRGQRLGKIRDLPNIWYRQHFLIPLRGCSPHTARHIMGMLLFP